MMRPAAAAVLLLGMSCSPVRVQPAPVQSTGEPVVDDAGCGDRAPTLRRVILEAAAKQKNIGISVAVSEHGRIVFSEGFGFADAEDSVSFPEKPGVAITPRLLAAQLGGIRHWGSERPALYARHFDDVRDILPLFANDSLVALPATGYHYSSYGYNLLAAAIQSAAAARFQDVVSRDVFIPLGLHDTQFDDVGEIVPLRSRYYTYYDLDTFAELSSPRRVPEVDYSHNIAGGDMRTAVEDMAHFGDALTHPGLLSSQSWEMLYRQPRVGTVESSMSFGWFVSPADRRPTRININGANPGMQAAIYVYPAARLVIAIAANTWGVGSRSGDMTGSAPTQLPSRLAAVCMH